MKEGSSAANSHLIQVGEAWHCHSHLSVIRHSRICAQCGAAGCLAPHAGGRHRPKVQRCVWRGHVACNGHPAHAVGHQQPNKQGKQVHKLQHQVAGWASLCSVLTLVAKPTLAFNAALQVKLVLERVQRPLPSAPVWYNKGQLGLASVERDTLQLPVSFFTTTQEDDWSQDLVAPGRPMYVGFHRSSLASLQVRCTHAPLRAGCRRHQHHLESCSLVIWLVCVVPVRHDSARAWRPGSRGCSTCGKSWCMHQTWKLWTYQQRRCGKAEKSTYNLPILTAYEPGAPCQALQEIPVKCAGGQLKLWFTFGAMCRSIDRQAGIAAFLTRNTAAASSSGASTSATTNNKPGGPSDKQASHQAHCFRTALYCHASHLVPCCVTALHHVGPSWFSMQVKPLLPWLLVTSSRMNTRDLTVLASLRGLGSMLELSLSLTQTGALSVRGSESMQVPEVSSLTDSRLQGCQDCR